VHPAQASLFDFDPAFTDGRQAALLEGLAAALSIEQGKVTMAGVGKEQRFEKAHGVYPVRYMLRRLAVWHDKVVTVLCENCNFADSSGAVQEFW
jgi:hypothetical protein